MTVLNSKNFDAWVADLRTTKAPQGQGAMHRNGRWCCLGRLMVVLKVPSQGFTEEGEVFSDNAIVPAVKHFPNDKSAERCHKLWKKNDSGWTFPKIADELAAHKSYYLGEDE